jgi:hypothetical protein
MDTRKIFRGISQKLRIDFENTAEVKHPGSRGTMRENGLKDFLGAGRLPSKYGIGSGEIVGRVLDTSRQSDLVIYDNLNGVKLLYDADIQVFPIDSVYGIIEVKSALSKTELIDSLEKIKRLKEMAPGGAVSQSVGNGFQMVHKRPRPFGMVFAYSLADNSLDSLLDNLREWERNVPSELWPNYVCILDTGTIFHYGKPFEKCLDSDKMTSGVWPSAIAYEADSLFEFYCALHDVCAHMNLGAVELREYYEPATRIGKFAIRGHVVLELEKDGEPKRKVRFTEAAIERVVTWCAAHGPLRYGDVLRKRLGAVPIGFDAATLSSKAFLYNPDNLLGLDDLDFNPVVNTGRGARATIPCLANSHCLEIDNHYYVIATDGFTESDLENV